MKSVFVTMLSVFVFLMLCSSVNAQWVQTGLTSGDITSLAVKDSIIFAGSRLGVVYVSTNYGMSWVPDTLPMDGLDYSVSDIVLSGNNIFAGTAGRGVFLSTNNGADWTPVRTGLNISVRCLIMKGSNLFAGTSTGVYLSTNSGATWNQVGITDNSITKLISKDNNIFAGTYYSPPIYLSTDNGTTWNSSSTGAPDRVITGLGVTNSNVFFGNVYGQVFTSTNSGTSWTEADSGMPGFTVGTAPSTFVLYNNNLFTGTNGDGVFLTTNNGMIWEAVNTDLINKNVHALAIQGDYIIAGTYTGGVWKRPLSQMVTGVSFSETLPKTYELNQNYPNPFNPTTTLKYFLPIRSQVTIIVHDLLGRDVATIVSGIQEAGHKQVVWYAENMPSGIYFYTLNAGTFTQTKKLVLMR